ncbi:OsmC family protein [Furfurilactobacillus siliginis]|uniref:Dihydroneopterin aldolase n=1 Tax=Furfurilactobacillus siliginis TaxID=348151 RepID=A0A0R2L7C0_9LACO|nr:OsmC family protein [Furfurilactobacillus siliginis]KRN95098.1 redox protein, regulator of disulfide bond formation [Furfurilactobacillus siliginis]GEK28355.1 dihydroneopterin aldolase [Furfurilactobacillus siliginis]
MAVEGSLYHTTVVNENGLVGQSFVEGNEGLALGVSSSLVDAAGTNPEQFIGFALSTCFNATLRLVEGQHRLPQDTEVKTQVDIVKDTVGYKFVVDAQVMFPNANQKDAQQILDEALDQCPVAKLLKDNDTVSFRIVNSFSDDDANQFGE